MAKKPSLIEQLDAAKAEEEAVTSEGNGVYVTETEVEPEPVDVPVSASTAAEMAAGAELVKRRAAQEKAAQEKAD